MTEERMYVTVPVSYRKDKRVFLGDEGVALDFLAERMRQAMVGRDRSEVFLRGDGDVQLQELMDVMDRLKDGGVAAGRHRRPDAAAAGADSRWTRSARSSTRGRAADDGLARMARLLGRSARRAAGAVAAGAGRVAGWPCRTPDTRT